jgi:alpha-tubulin suppressor-like RCC1 family protein
MPGEGVIGILRRRPNGVGKQLWSFGQNTFAALADSTTINRSSPVQNFSGGNNWIDVSVGSNSLGAGIKADGTLWVWGSNVFGSLGLNTAGFYSAVSSPIQTITYGTTWSQVSCSTDSVMAVKTDGTLWAWGSNYFGMLGDNTTVHKSSPVQVAGFATTWSSVSKGPSHTCGIKKDGTLWCWGYNQQGQLGDNTITHRSSPVQTIAGGSNYLQVSCGDGFTAAVKTDGTLWLWGANSRASVNNGNLGDNSVIHRSSPVQTISFGTNWQKVSCGSVHTAAVKKDGSLWLWGQNTGQLGDNTGLSRSSPVQTIVTSYNWIDVSCGGAHTLKKTIHFGRGDPTQMVV